MTDHTHYSPSIATVDAVISSSGTTSSAVDLGGTSLCGIHMPSAFTGSSITFKAAASATDSYRTVTKNGISLSATVAADQYIVLDPTDFAGIRFLQVVSGASESASRTLTLSVRPV